MKALLLGLLRLLEAVAGVALIMLSPLALAAIAQKMGATHGLGMEAAKLIYAWPIITAICVIVFVISFREPIRDFIRGLRRFKAAGVEMEAEQQALPKTERDPRKNEISWQQWFLELGSKLSSVDRDVISQLGEVQQQAFTNVLRWW